MPQFYCLKCKEKKEIDTFEEAFTEKGNRKFLKSICPVCNTKVAKMVGKND